MRLWVGLLLAYSVRGQESFAELQKFSAEKDAQFWHADIEALTQSFERLQTKLLNAGLIELQQGKDGTLQSRLKRRIFPRLARLASGPQDPGHPREHPFGWILRIRLVVDARVPRLAGMLFDFDLGSHQASFLAVFRQRRGQWAPYWTQGVRWRNANWDYSRISDAKLLSLQNRPFLFTVVGTQQSANGSYGLALRQYSLDGPSPQESFALDLHGKAHQFALDADGFRLEVMDSSSNGLQGCCLAFPYRFRWSGSVPKRIEPVAFDPAQFVEVWGNLTWDKAQEWTVQGSREELRRVHAGIRDAQGYFGAEIVALPCDATGSIWQVEYGGYQEPKGVFLVRHPGESRFEMVSHLEPLRPGCDYNFVAKWRRSIFANAIEW